MYTYVLTRDAVLQIPHGTIDVRVTYLEELALLVLLVIFHRFLSHVHHVFLHRDLAVTSEVDVGEIALKYSHLLAIFLQFIE